LKRCKQFENISLKYDEKNDLVVEKDGAARLQLILVHKAQDGDVVLAAHTKHSKVSF
jgi:hypothetical protein